MASLLHHCCWWTLCLPNTGLLRLKDLQHRDNSWWPINIILWGYFFMEFSVQYSYWNLSACCIFVLDILCRLTHLKPVTVTTGIGILMSSASRTLASCVLFPSGAQTLAFLAVFRWPVQIRCHKILKSQVSKPDMVRALYKMKKMTWWWR